jgi:hypothetical protein
MTVDLVVLKPEQEVEITTGRNRLLDAAKMLVIADETTEKDAWDIVNRIGQMEKLIRADFAPAKKAAHEAHKAITSQESGHLDALREPDKIVRQKLGEWEMQKRAAAEEERKRLEAEAEELRQRLQRESDAEAARVAEQRRLEAAVKAEEEGASPEAVAEALEQPVVVAPAVVPQVVVPKVEPRKVEGAGAMVEQWDFTITDLAALPREYMVPNESSIRQVVKALKGEAHIPGITVTCRMVPRVTGRR